MFITNFAPKAAVELLSEKFGLTFSDRLSPASKCIKCPSTFASIILSA